MLTDISNLDFQPNDSQQDRVEKLNQLKAAILEGGVQRVFTNSYGDPNGNQTANGAAVYLDEDGSGWKHPESAGVSNTGWVQMFA